MANFPRKINLGTRIYHSGIDTTPVVISLSEVIFFRFLGVGEMASG